MAGVRVGSRIDGELGGVKVTRLANRKPSALGNDRSVVLYFHGGAYCVGSPSSHRSITTRLAHAASAEVVVPDYRLTPENPWPAAIDDCEAVYRALLAEGRSPSDIVLSGDSAGGGLVLSLLVRLSQGGETLPAGAVLISPFCDPTFTGESLTTAAQADPMIHIDWLHEATRLLAAQTDAPDQHPLRADVRGWPPVLIQVGEHEVLLSDSLRLADHLHAAGVPVQLELYEGLWHVFHLQAVLLAAGREAIGSMGRHARQCLDAVRQQRAAA